jgi:DNA-binding NtrC family response regulator
VLPQTAINNSPLSTLIGSSAAMKQIHRLVSRMGKSRFPVLILGETGTVKEVVARAIHAVEGQGNFVVVDCSSLVGPLMESELFGYAKGAFTGAHTQKLGLLDAANGGTAFFDEIGELPLEMQMKLLRVLQQKEYRAVGALSQRTSNFRVIAATNRDLTAEVEARRFRQDLFYRLNVMRIRLAPLRERRDDIPALVDHFVGRYGNDHRIPDEIMHALVEYDWPGNIRELEHTVQQMVAMNSGPWLGPADLPSPIRNRKLEHDIATAESLGNLHSSLNSYYPQSITPLAEVEKKAILNAIDYTKGDRSVAAEMLGIGRTTLYRKLKEYGL